MVSIRRVGSSTTSLLLGFLLAACADDALLDLDPGEDTPPEGLEIVVSGSVARTDGSPVSEARITVFVENAGFSTSRGGRTDAAGRFAISSRIDERHGIDLRGDLVARVDVRALPKQGEGYDLGTAEVTGLELRYRAIPAADTTFVDLTLPPNQSESRRPTWVRPASFRSFSSPIRTDALRVYESESSCVVARDRDTGTPVWCAGSSGGLAGLPYAVVGGMVVIARGDVLTGVSAASGEVVWTRSGVPNRPLAVAEPDGLVATDGATMAAFELRTGATLWRVPIEPGGHPNLALGSDLACVERLVSAPAAARIECRARSDGALRWKRFVGSSPWLAVTDDRILLAGGDSERAPAVWIALDPRTGGTLWRSDATADGGFALSADGQLLVACDGGADPRCVAVRTADGLVVWRKDFPARSSAPAVDGDSVYVIAGAAGPLHVLDLATGALRERIEPDPHDGRGFCGRAPAARDGMVFAFGCADALYAFDVR